MSILRSIAPCSDPKIRDETIFGFRNLTRMDVLELSSGLWRWTTFHEEWREDVGSVYCETAAGVALIDPLVPHLDEEAERFWRALDRDVSRVGGDVHVLVTVFWHTRSAAAMVERYDAHVWAPNRGRAVIARRAGVVTDAFGPNDPLPGGLRAFETARASEVVFWIPEHCALVPGDALLGDGAGGIRMCPESWLPAGRTHVELAASLQPLLDLPVERVLLSHGTPVLADGRAALAAALAVK
jgi:glyoxylase-like metal-dependent hydrolase (beta-lactamase superfamily II)